MHRTTSVAFKSLSCPASTAPKAWYTASSGTASNVSPDPAVQLLFTRKPCGASASGQVASSTSPPQRTAWWKSCTAPPDAPPRYDSNPACGGRSEPSAGPTAAAKSQWNVRISTSEWPSLRSRHARARCLPEHEPVLFTHQWETQRVSFSHSILSSATYVRTCLRRFSGILQQQRNFVIRTASAGRLRRCVASYSASTTQQLRWQWFRPIAVAPSCQIN